jgi:hypothetical protein
VATAIKSVRLNFFMARFTGNEAECRRLPVSITEREAADHCVRRRLPSHQTRLGSTRWPGSATASGIREFREIGGENAPAYQRFHDSLPFRRLMAA